MQARKSGYPTVRKVSGLLEVPLDGCLPSSCCSWVSHGVPSLGSCICLILSQSARALSQLVNPPPISTNTFVSSLFPTETVKQFPTIFSPVLNSQLWTQSHHQLLLSSCLCFLKMPLYFLSSGLNSLCIFCLFLIFSPLEMANKTSSLCAVLS